MAESESDWSPPKDSAGPVLVASLPSGVQWYELRMPLKTISYDVSRFDDALTDAKALERIFKGELYLCFKDSEGLHAERIW